MPEYPDVLGAKEALLNHGALGALMSGSGSTVFGLFSDHDKARAAKHALAKNRQWQLFFTDMLIDTSGCITDV
jgi:4-diphosphocytidyl-2-C-methyl-D-erythritol kinase